MFSLSSLKKIDLPKTNIIELLYNQSLNNPNNIFLFDENNTITYSSSIDKICKISKQLISLGINRGTKVAFLTSRSINMILSIYGLINNSGIYVPIDVNAPNNRILEIINSLGIKYIFCDSLNFSKSLDLAESLSLKGIYLIDDGINIADYNNSLIHQYNENEFCDYNLLNLTNIYDDDIIYIMHTSGSTGKPKSVGIKHISLLNRILWVGDEFKIVKNDKIIFKTPISFDVSIFEIFGFGCFGGSILCLSDGKELDSELINIYLEKYNISYIHFVPSMFEMFLKYIKINLKLKKIYFSSLKYIFLSGEDLKDLYVKTFFSIFNNNISLVNLYGPTEATIDVMYKIITKNNYSDIVTLGQPIINNYIYILNNNLEFTNEGEIYIGGIQLSDGYINNIELSKKAYIDDPYKKGSIIYKTGDIGILLENNEIKYKGRTDNQIKIYGKRVDLLDVENNLLKLELFYDVSIIFSENKLICFYKSDNEYDKDFIKTKLSKLIPKYMIPYIFIKLEFFPINKNGKKDRKKLLLMLEDIILINNDENKIKNIWKKYLRLSELSDNSNFFNLGGQSIDAMKIIYEINDYLGTNLSLNFMYKYPIFNDFYNNINYEKNNLFSSINDEKKISKGQLSVFLHQYFYPKSSFYNVLTKVNIFGDLDINILKESLYNIISNNDSFNINFQFSNNDYPIVKKNNLNLLNFKYIDISYESTIDKINIVSDKKKYLLYKIYDLSKDILYDIILIKLKKSEYVLFFNIHHIIIDGNSIDLFFTQLKDYYEGKIKNIDNKMIITNSNDYISYLDYEFQLYNSSYFDEMKEFWKNRLLNLPNLIDYSKIEICNKNNASHNRLIISSVKLKLIKNYCKNNNITIFLFLLGVYYISLDKLTGLEDIIIGVPISNKISKNYKNTIGYFVNILPIRIKLPYKSISYNKIFSELNKIFITDISNGEININEIVDLLKVRRKGLSNPIFNTIFNFISKQSLESISITGNHKKLNVGNLKFNLFTELNKDSKFDITLFCSEYNNLIEFICEYNKDIIGKNTVSLIFSKIDETIDEIIKI